MKRACLIFCCACGAAPGALEGEVRLAPGLSLSQVQSLDVSMLAPSDPSGPVSCATDAAKWFTHDVVYHRFIAANALYLSAVPSGKNWVFVVSAYASSDGSGAPIATGCADQVSVTAGQTRTLSIVLDAAR